MKKQIKNMINRFYKWLTNDGFECEESKHVCGDMKFIWGVKSYDDFSSAPANLWTMNDIDIVYDEENKEYLLSVETIYDFDNGREGQIKYYDNLLNEFTKFMIDNGYDMDLPDSKIMIKPITLTRADTITELYFMFKIFVKGFKVVCEDIKEGICV